ncbi:MiaB/RimO family radical SAM methylthiotransferase [Candidatus Microgenomates bacterium]|nr:MiaB/RimO family radical SAM methylthiotransferase [Candidatus Microgenomates bacterium]
MKYYIQTFGCQMNKSDSEQIAGFYQSRGFLPAKDIEEADEIVINTCSVRQTAEDRALGFIKNIKSEKGAKKPKIIVTGCMLRLPQKFLQEKMPQVDEFKKIEEFTLHTPYTIRYSPIHAWVPIMEGCNNFCTYCVVPYSRGRERSRPMEEIICGVEELVKRGYREITLLGQNVNSYGNDFSPQGKTTLQNHHRYNHSNNIYHYSDKDSFFALLLYALHEIPRLKKIKFMTSNPWDLTDDIIRAISLPKIDRYLHLPVQSGDDEILKRMNRKYTAKQYLDLITKIQQLIPDIKIGTDIIVGFPGETGKQFQNTVDLCKKVGFEIAYISMYSPRPQTAAARLKDNIPHREKRRRWLILEKLINRSNKEKSN